MDASWLYILALFLLPVGVAVWERGVGNVTAVVGTVCWMAAVTMVVVKLLL